ncbi:MAG: 8-amino-7-oxononanoate synthase [Methanothermococcus sp.]|uniref:8-amino-7-oxononanoate synthase n=1 Tax=Methanothermococcus TaxID=155862 RepID=UPI000360DAF1|nr:MULTISPECIES: 8-amino-7-oxononanoate synthase [Methanothermococcus]MDK2790947.1 8-amino-7-oxononanoate synthase [Methanothermococcus sp.]MDK2978339.1 8-amino-7-oxononanoate synthase [Bacteroidales bacterium]MDK2987923.1 8-amino-7-oxononanoate synthase [Methanothermococcus sp.]
MFRKQLQKEIEDIKNQNLYRSFKSLANAQEDNNILDFSSNDYLCLSKHPEVISAVKEGLKYGAGSTGSRLTSGNINHKELEEKIAEFKGTEKALVYSSGYATNVGVISTLCKKGDLILSDKLNHASIIDGCRLSKADVLVYNHCDTNHLMDLLEENAGKYNNIFIITDGVFSMDGDVAPLDELKKIADEFNGILIIDDAHGTGVLGNGRGTLKHFNLKPSDNIIQIGTLSKAVGGLGGFVCGIEELIEYLINKSRSFIYSTSLPPSVVSGCIKSFELMENGALTKKLQKNIELANKIFKEHDLIGAKRRATNSEGICSIEEDNLTPIYPFIFKEKTMELAEHLIKNNIFCVGIRYPTVPKGMERLRVSINVGHSEGDFRALCECIKMF